MEEDHSIYKKKRLHARTFRDLYVAKAKKFKRPLLGSASCADNLQPSGVVAECKSGSYHSHRQQERIDSEVESQPGHWDATPEQHDYSAPEVHEKPSSSTDVQLHASGGTFEGGDFGSLKTSSGNNKKTISPVDSGHDATSKDEIEGKSSYGLLRLKRSDCKSSPSKFIEYWVPAGFSNLQLEKYCEILIKNSMILCSNLRREVRDVLIDALSMIRKCCDHPYVVDKSLQTFVEGEQPATDYVVTGIEASGKLLLLDKMLQEVKKKKLRVLIVFQSQDSKSKSVHLQHMLDDYLRQTFGEGSYTNIYREFDRAKKQAELDCFNNIESGRFVILIEKGSCQPIIKLSSVDFVILFNSDLNPGHDMKSLRKMSIQSQFDHLKVFRLYTPHSVEEKVLSLAKQGIALDRSICNISPSIAHMLLLWGTTHLFKKLDDFHGSCASRDTLSNMSENKIMHDVLLELAALMVCENNINCTLVSKVPEVDEGYLVDISLYGEGDEPVRDDDLPSHTIWSSLIEGKDPQWLLLPGSPRKVRRRSEIDSLCGSSEFGTQNLTKLNKKALDPRNKSQNLVKLNKKALCPREQSLCVKLNKKALRSRGASLCVKPSLRKPASWRKAGKMSGQLNCYGVRTGPLSSKADHIDVTFIEDFCNKRTRQLIFRQKMEIREFYQDKGERRKKLEEEHKLEVDLLNQRCGELEIKEDLKKLDDWFCEKVEEHERQMDTKRKELYDIQRASRLEIEQLLAELKKKSMEGTLSTVDYGNLLVPDLGSQAVKPKETPMRATSDIPSSAELAEKIHSDGAEKSLMDDSVQNGDPVVPPEEIAETEILSLESDGEDDALSTCTMGVSDAKGDTESNHGAEAEAAPSEIHFKHVCQDMEQNDQTEGVASSDCDLLEKSLQGLTGNEADIFLGNSEGGCLAHCLNLSEASGVAMEPVNNFCSSHNLSEPQVCAMSGATKCLEPSSNSPEREVQVQDNDIADMDAADVAKLKSSGHMTEKLAANLTSSSRAVVREQTCKTHVNSLPLVKQDTSVKGQPCSDHSVQNTFAETIRVPGSVESNGGNNLSMGGSGEGTERITELLCNVSAMCTTNESQLGALPENGYCESLSNLADKGVQNGANNMELLPRSATSGTEVTDTASLGSLGTVPGSLSIENLVKLPSSTAMGSGCVLPQPQSYSRPRRSSHFEQSVASAGPLRQSPFQVGALNHQITGIQNSLGQNQTHVPLRNLESLYLPTVESMAVTSSLLQSVAHTQEYASNVVCTPFMRPTNSHIQELRSNVMHSARPDPLQNELLRIQKQLQEANKTHEEQVMHVKHAFKMRMEEIQTKYDLLMQEAENAWIKKRRDFEFRYARVRANKALAKMMVHNRPPSALSQGFQLVPMQNFLSEHRNLRTEELAVPHMQIVRHSSALLSVDTTQPPCFSGYQIGNSLLDHQNPSPAPSFHPARLIPPLSTPNFSPAAYSIQNQQNLVHPLGSPFVPVSLVQHDGTPDNPVLI